MQLVKLVVPAFIAAAALSVVPTGAQARVPEARPVASVPKAVVKAPAQVSEGDRVTLNVRVPNAKDAMRVELQERVSGVYANTWTDRGSKRAKARMEFRTTIVAENEALYRVAVTYRDRTRPVVSKPVELTVWRWVELRDFTPYYESPLAGYGSTTMNGDVYAVWGGYAGSTQRAWEARVTPGRNCTRFRAVLGLADSSDDRSSGVISFSVEEATTVYQSPTLVPGMTLPVELDLASKPFRFGLSAANTSPDKVKGYPMVGNGAFYCTGIRG